MMQKDSHEVLQLIDGRLQTRLPDSQPFVFVTILLKQPQMSPDSLDFLPYGQLVLSRAGMDFQS